MILLLNLKKFLIYSFFIVGISMFMNANQVEAKSEFSLGWEPWPPFQYEDETKQLTGFDIELITTIMENAGLKVSYRNTPWKRLLFEVQSGRMDMAGAASKTKEREEFAFFTNPYRKETIVLFVQKGQSHKYKFKTLEQLTKSNFKLGVANGYYYGEKYAELIKNPIFKGKVQTVNKDELNIRKLMKNRIDGFLMEPVAATAMLKKLSLLDKAEILPVPIYSDNIFAIFSKASTSTEVVKKFNKSLKELKANGKYDQIVGKYIKE